MANLIWNRAGQREIKVANIKYSTPPDLFMLHSVLPSAHSLCKTSYQSSFSDLMNGTVIGQQLSALELHEGL